MALPPPEYPIPPNSALANILTIDRTPTNAFTLTSKVCLPAGSHFAFITRADAAPQHNATWQTVQVGPDQHVEMRCAFLYLNHSCEPSLEVHVLQNIEIEGDGRDGVGKAKGEDADAAVLELRVAKNRDLRIGDELSFFYPSTEWEFDRPFECWCGGRDCVGLVTGAGAMEEEMLRKWFVNEHIWELMHRRESARGGKKWLRVDSI